MDTMFHNTKFILFFLTFLFFGVNSQVSIAQKVKTHFDSVYIEVATKIRNEDLDKAIFLADSMYQNSKKDHEKIKSSLLLALFYEDLGKLADAIFWATESEKLAIKKNNYELQVRSSGYLATLYRRVDLTTESNYHLRNAEKANSKRKSEPNYPIIQSSIHHEKALQELEKNNYGEAIIELNKSESSLREIEDISHLDFSLAAIYETFAECYLKIKEFKKAENISKKALALDIKYYPELSSLLNNKLALIELNNKNYDQAFKYLEVAKKYTLGSKNLTVQFKIYETLAKYHKAVGNYKESIHYSELVAEVNNKRTKAIKNISNEVLNKMHKNEDEIVKINYYLVWIASLLIVVIAATIAIAKIFLKRKNTKYKSLIKYIEDKSSQNLGLNKTSEIELETEKSSKTELDIQQHKINHPYMPPETEERLLFQLKALENNNFFTRKDVTISTLSSSLNSNQRYVSYIIKTHKKTDFKNYISELRVNYVISLLREKPEFLKYKISYIADYAGFSSHSKFASVFKRVTGLTPSAFIAEVKIEHKSSEQDNVNR